MAHEVEAWLVAARHAAPAAGEAAMVDANLIAERGERRLIPRREDYGVEGLAGAIGEAGVRGGEVRDPSLDRDRARARTSWSRAPMCRAASVTEAE